MTNPDRNSGRFRYGEKLEIQSRLAERCGQQIVLVCDKLINSSGKTSVIGGSNIWM